MSIDVINFKEYINEMPLHIDDISRNGNMLYISDEFNKGIKDKRLYNIDKDIYLYSKDVLEQNIYVFYVVDGELYAGAHLVATNIMNTSCYEEILVASSGKTKGIMYKLYSTISKIKNTYIMSDALQTSNSKKNWLRWLNKKENIKDIFLYHTTEKKKIEFKQNENTWCKSTKCKLRRILVKFN